MRWPSGLRSWSQWRIYFLVLRTVFVGLCKQNRGRILGFYRGTMTTIRRTVMMTTVRSRISVVAYCVQIKNCYSASRLFSSADIPSSVIFAAPGFGIKDTFLQTMVSQSFKVGCGRRLNSRFMVGRRQLTVVCCLESTTSFSS